MMLTNHEIHVDLQSRQAALLLAGLEALRGELGKVGEDLINLLRGAGIVPPGEPGSVAEKKPIMIKSLL